jgi:hypothetical protein
LQRSILAAALFLCAGPALWAQPAQPAAQPDEEPERLEQRAYVRKFSAGISLGLVPFNLFPKETLTQKIEAARPVEIISNVDPESNRFGVGFIAQVALTDRWAVAVAPSYRKVKFHAFLRKFEGVDNASTFIDERDKTEINEDTIARFIEIPALARYYSKSRFDSGPRWFFEGGPVLRHTRQVTMARDTVPPRGARFQDSIPLPYRSNSLGVTGGIGIQFIDDFGIRAIPEVRYTRWFQRPFDSVNGRSRVNQVEVVLTFSF